MNFLSVCQDSNFLSLISLGKAVIEIICIIAPIALILMSGIDVAKIVLNPDPKNISKVSSTIVKRAIAAVMVFFIPSFVSIILGYAGSVSYSTTACWTNANKATIQMYREAEETQKEAEKEAREQENKKAEEDRKILEALREAKRDENSEAANQAAANANPFSSGTATGLAAKMIAMAQNEYNNRELYSFPYRYTEQLWALPEYGYNYAWCAAFVAVMSRESGVNEERVKYLATGVWSYKSHFQSGKNGIRYELSQAHGGTYIPKMGDYIFFDWAGLPNASDGPDHIGLVKGVSGDKVLIIDGNYSNTIADRYMYLTDKAIIGYGVWE